MQNGFRLFCPEHLGVIVLTLGAPFALLRLRRPDAVRKTLSVLLAANEIGWYAYRYSTEGFRFPEGLPLQLSDVVVWLTVSAAWTGRAALFELSWYWGIAGAGMAILTPDLWAPFWSYPTAYFFLAHGLVVITPVFLWVSGVTRARPGSFWRALIWVNVYAGAVGTFNAIFKTNYMYLCQKPAGASLLDWFGPWPWYLLGGEVLALGLFWLLGLPFRIAAKSPAARGRSAT